MPHYHLNLYNDVVVIDEEGSDYVDLAAAQVAATRSARELMAEHVALGRPINLGHRMEVLDEHGEVLSVLYFRDLVTFSGG
jgi:hypothetical protein